MSFNKQLNAVVVSRSVPVRLGWPALDDWRRERVLQRGQYFPCPEVRATHSLTHSPFKALLHFQPIFTTLDMTVLSPFCLIGPLLQSVLCLSTNNGTYVINCAGYVLATIN